MLHKRLACTILLFSQAWASGAFSATCSSPQSFEARQKETSDKKILVIPFEGDPETNAVVTVLFKEYLGLAKGLSVITAPSAAHDVQGILSEATRSGAQYAVSGQIRSSRGEKSLQIILYAAGSAKTAAGEMARIEGTFLFSDSQITLNDLLEALVQKVASSFQSSWPPKKLEPLLNVSNSTMAYRDYADGMNWLDHGSTLEASVLEHAAQAFQRAIQADYNYVAAYRGLAEALAAQGAVLQNERQKQAAKTAWTKAKLLNPYVTKIREPRIEWYLKADTQDLCGDKR